MKRSYSMPFGAEAREGGVRFALWAPHARSIAVELDGGRETLALQARNEGRWELLTAAARPGTRYMYVVDGERRVPDPASRFAPDGVHGPSEVIDPRAFEWTDVDWKAGAWESQVLYEMHIGAFTPSGTYAGAIERLDDLVRLGVTALEIMPLSAAPGKRNWGYDGVAPFAPTCRYGRPDDLKHFVVQAHARGLCVLLDVVYNHFGPEGNYLGAYAGPFFTSRHRTPWGAAIDFERCKEVREFVVCNASYWLEEYGFDGLRLDAVQEMYDDSRPDILEETAERVSAGKEPKPFLILETDQPPRIDRLARYHAQWNDPAHHALHALATGETDGYYAEYAQRPAERLALALTAAPRPSAFVQFLQNHDQIGNRAAGDRLAEPADLVSMAAAIVLLAPSIPMLFMGEEWGASSPFLFFCDLEPALADAIREGRRRECARFAGFADTDARPADPGAVSTFERSVLRWEERERTPHRETLAFYRDLLSVRAREIAPRLRGLSSDAGRILAVQERALSVRWSLSDGSALSMRANFDDAPCELPRLDGGEALVAIGERHAEGERAAPRSLLWEIRRA